MTSDSEHLRRLLGTFARLTLAFLPFYGAAAVLFAHPSLAVIAAADLGLFAAVLLALRQVRRGRARAAALVAAYALVGTAFLCAWTVPFGEQTVVMLHGVAVLVALPHVEARAVRVLVGACLVSLLSSNLLLERPLLDGPEVPLLLERAISVLSLLATAVLAVILLLQHTSRLREAAAVARAAETRARRLGETNLIGVLSFRKGGAVVDANDAFLSMLGFDREDLHAGRINLRALSPEEDAAEDAAAIAELYGTGAFTPREKVLLRKSGGRIPVLLGGALDEGSDDSGVAFVLDLSDRKRAEVELRNWHRRYRAIVENGLDGIKLLDATGRVLYASPQTERILGIPCGELEGRHAADLVHPEDREGWMASFASCLANPGLPIHAELRYRHDGGGFRYVESVRVNHLDQPGLEAIVCHYRDVSLRRSLEDQFRQAQKMEAVGRLAGGIAHDFNNLLSVVLSGSSLALEELRPGDPLREDLEQIKKAGERARDLTHQLLAFSRRQVLRTEPLDLNAVLEDVETLLRRLVGEGVEISIGLDPTGAPLSGDRTQLEQVIMNLVVNARDAMPQGGRLSIRTARATIDGATADAAAYGDVRPGTYVLLEVSDTGTGMDAATRARIFEPFFTTKEKGKGTGLGLPTVFGIVKQSGGAIAVESEPGRGSTFRVLLPRADPPSVGPGRAEAPADPSLGGRESILLVEDDDQVRHVAKTILRRFGYKVREARSAAEALLAVERRPAEMDLLVTDVVMPQMSGPELAARLLPASPGLRVLYMSGYTDDLASVQGLERAGAAFLQKPLTPEGLTAAVRRALDAPAPR
jgi:PAS domain S-box-containing protein